MGLDVGRGESVDVLFRERVGVVLDEVVGFEELGEVLERVAWSIPFENLCIMEKRTAEITERNLIQKVLERNEGGLCYELNTLLYLFLLENHFKATLYRAVTYNQFNQDWNTVGKTHVFTIIEYEGQRFIVDTGFGGNLPLRPVPLTGETVTSSNGEFRVVQEDTEFGDLIFYYKLKHKDSDWKKGYAFDSRSGFHDISSLNEVQKIIVEHPESSFNKKPLINQLTDKGSKTLTDTSYTEWIDGQNKKVEIDDNQFEELANHYFGLSSKRQKE
jgi:N-hydroxyarylamine O-acetyltransferase